MAEFSHQHKSHYKKTNKTHNLRLTANITALALLENKQNIKFSHQHKSHMKYYIQSFKLLVFVVSEA